VVNNWLFVLLAVFFVLLSFVFIHQVRQQSQLGCNTEIADRQKKGFQKVLFQTEYAFLLFIWNCFISHFIERFRDDFHYGTNRQVFQLLFHLIVLILPDLTVGAERAVIGPYLKAEMRRFKDVTKFLHINLLAHFAQILKQKIFLFDPLI